MTDNIKIRTEDVLEILDPKILTTSSHTQLNVSVGESYDSVLAKIAARSPTLNEKLALENAQSPSALNPYTTITSLDQNLLGKIPWKTVGLPGSGADFTGTDETPFLNAFSSCLSSGASWVQVREGTFTFTNTLTIPEDFKIVGTSANVTNLTGNVDPILSLSSNALVSYLSVTQEQAGQTGIQLDNYTHLDHVITSASGGVTLAASGKQNINIFECGLLIGEADFSNVTNSFLHGCYVDSPGFNGLMLTNCSNMSVTGSLFKNGILRLETCTDIRVVANHLNDGITNLTPLGSNLFRANTPNTNNNEVDDFGTLLQYIGSPSVTSTQPPYSNNYAGPLGENLTARASSLDLLIQWRYEERNFLLTAASEPTTISWNPLTYNLTSTGDLNLISAHRNASWVLPTLNVTIPDGWALYYTLDRALDNTPITLTPGTASLGNIVNDRLHRQTYVLAFCLGSTLWWRGGGGSRFPATGNLTGTYFVDGTSKSFLDYIGAVDYNDSDPSYSSNFAGVQGESLTTRVGKTDTLLKRLFEYSNIGFNLNGGNISVETSGSSLVVSMSNNLIISLPHVAGHIIAPSGTWTLATDQLIYFSWNQATLAGSDQAIIGSFVVNNGSLPLPEDNQTIKYFEFARRYGNSIYLWDDTEIPSGGQYPIPLGRNIVPVTSPAVFADNIVWTGGSSSLLSWEGLALVCSTGIDLNRNLITDGNNTLAENESLKITHTWNSGSTPNYVTITKVTLPLITPLKQNEFLWAIRKNNTIIFGS